MSQTAAASTNAVTLTLGLCHATGQVPVTGLSMRKAGRAAWNEEDWNIAAETTCRFAVHGGFLPLEAYEREWGPFPTAIGRGVVARAAQSERKS